MNPWLQRRLDAPRAEKAEYAVLVLAVLVFLVLALLRLGPAPLVLAPWLVIAAIATHLLTRNVPADE